VPIQSNQSTTTRMSPYQPPLAHAVGEGLGVRADTIPPLPLGEGTGARANTGQGVRANPESRQENDKEYRTQGETNARLSANLG